MKNNEIRTNLELALTNVVERLLMKNDVGMVRLENPSKYLEEIEEMAKDIVAEVEDGYHFTLLDLVEVI